MYARHIIQLHCPVGTWSGAVLGCCYRFTKNHICVELWRLILIMSHIHQNTLNKTKIRFEIRESGSRTIQQSATSSDKWLHTIGIQSTQFIGKYKFYTAVKFADINTLLHTEKYFRNLVNPNQILFRLTRCRTSRVHKVSPRYSNNNPVIIRIIFQKKIGTLFRVWVHCHK